MSLNIPNSRSEVKQRSQTDVQNTLPESNPFLPNSYLDAIITAFSGRIYDFYLNLDQVIKEMFVDTADGTFLERWGSYVGVLRKPATQAVGNITITGTAGSVIPINTQLTTSDSKLYQTLQSTTILLQNIQVTQITRVSQTAIVATASPHLLTSSQSVTISGAVQSEYNGTYTITVTSAQEFTYTISGSPSTPATGTISAQSTFASAGINSIDYGSDTNLVASSPLTFLTPIAGVSNTARVQYSGVVGGEDQESDTDLRNRILFRYQNPVALFNENAIIVQAETVPGVTRVFVEGPGTLVNTLSASSVIRNNQVVTVVTTTSHGLEDGQIMSVLGAVQTGYNVTKKVITIDDVTFAYSILGAPTSPATGTITVQTGIPNGQVIVYFTRDDDANIIPTSSEVQQVKDALTNYNTGIMPANVDSNDVIVKAPVPVTVDFTFTSLDPNTTSMQNAVLQNLKSYFRESTVVSQDVLEVAYQSVIYRTIDPETGISVRNFLLSAPTGDIAIQTGQLAVLGTVSFL